MSNETEVTWEEREALSRALQRLHLIDLNTSTKSWRLSSPLAGRHRMEPVMSNQTWKRSDSISLGRTAMQSGIASCDDAKTALMIGARIQAHGFTVSDIDAMIVNHYRHRAHDLGGNL